MTAASSRVLIPGGPSLRTASGAGSGAGYSSLPGSRGGAVRGVGGLVREREQPVQERTCPGRRRGAHAADELVPVARGASADQRDVEKTARTRAGHDRNGV